MDVSKPPSATSRGHALSSTVAAVFLAVYYPTLFAISINWYAFNTRELALLLVGVGVLAIVLWALYRALYPLLGRFLIRRVGLEPGKAKNRASAIVLAIACVWPLFFLLEGTLREALGGSWQVKVAFPVVLVVVSW